ncbi:unnamed protein product [Kluyveromyces dobzhanskii CBS 2104]|uniref:WGS project CCBQ000000000 data, contig 00010 n=1 Tax=Kluyveromyces dobzhanskii CBS 2104 TaxID=1427455 RepID=A0A0A8LAF2_9SACH|nr:unnamed protein product [Kluyveromyces dobzhanskii CBS 2104]
MPSVSQDDVNVRGAYCDDVEGGSDSHDQNVKKRKYGTVDKHNEKKLLMPTASTKAKRFSQACDRCRLKKIKCDGVKPSCSNCKKIGYHCSTSDKLTRRGFPRGYTEMLENEVVKLQRLCGLVDEGGETVMEGSSEQLKRLGAATAATAAAVAAAAAAEASGPELGPGLKSAAATAATAGSVVPGAIPSAAAASAIIPAGQEFSDHTEVAQEAHAYAHASSYLPFINDSFHKFPNYTHDQVYLGNFSWNSIINTGKSYLKSFQYTRSIVQDPVLSYLNRHFPLSPSGVPINIPLSVDDLIRFIDKYLNSNQIFPYLLGTSWHQRMISVLSGTSTVSDPAVTIVLILIVQFELNCFNNETIFQAIKLLGSLSQDKLSSIQLINFGIRFFMSQENPYAIIWTNDLINFNQYMIINSALFLNYNNLVGHEHSTSKTIRLLTFYQFQVFQIWWCFINGLPKTNFLIDEFHPPTITEFPPHLKMFQLVYELILQLDGCHLQMLTNEANNKYQLLIESFGYKLIYQWKLYHHLQDHDFKQIQLENNDLLEIGITLVYLVCRFLHRPNSVELSYEIISLYWLLLSDNSNVKPINSRILKTIQFMPLNNKQLIEFCLLNLLKEPKETFNWYRYKKLLKRWVTIWMDDNDIFSRLISHYQLSIGMTDLSPTISNFKPMGLPTDHINDTTNLFKIYDDANDNIIDDEGYEEDNESDYNELIIMPKRRSMGHHPSARASSIHKAGDRNDFSLFNNKIDHIIIKE